MNEHLVATLVGLRGDPGLAVHLYEDLFNGRFWTLAWRSDVEASGFVGCQRADGGWEIPVFTQPDSSFFRRLAIDVPAAERVSVEGRTLWRQLLNDHLHDHITRVTVDPGEAHGISLSWEMILGMVNKYGLGSDRDP